ncbi:MAG: hypothetical protein KJ732_00530 [Candidatus Margulisbacteria bacterium]|nr:hypothetical protein [Candidatus Margulisiibacteriota bacterium]
MAIIGLGLILVAWLYQLYYVFKPRVEIKPFFVLVYALGLAALIFDGFRSGAYAPAWLNLTILIPVAIIFLKALKKQ